MLCHDAPVMRGGLKTIIDAEKDMRVVAETPSIDQALALIEEVRPEVIVTDLATDGAGLDTMRAVKSYSPSPHILVLASQATGEFFTLAMRAGADGYLTREAQPMEIVNAIRCLSKGQNYVNASIVTLLVKYICKTPRGRLDDPYDAMSEREKEVLCLAASGHTNDEMAEMLSLSKRTIHNVRARLMGKLGFHDRMQLVKYALRRGIISPEDV